MRRLDQLSAFAVQFLSSFQVHSAPEVQLSVSTIIGKEIGFDGTHQEFFGGASYSQRVSTKRSTNQHYLNDIRYTIRRATSRPLATESSGSKVRHQWCF